MMQIQFAPDDDPDDAPAVGTESLFHLVVRLDEELEKFALLDERDVYALLSSNIG